MATKINYDKNNDVFYAIENGNKNTINIPYDDDIVLRISHKEIKVVGLIMADFSIHHPKLAKSVGTKDEEFVTTYFKLWINSINDVIEKLRESRAKKTVFNKFVTSSKINVKGGEFVFK